MAADASEHVGAPMPVAPPSPPPPEQTVVTTRSVTDGAEEEPSQGEIDKANEYIDMLLPSLADDQKPCGMTGCITEGNQCVEVGNSLPTENSEVGGAESSVVPSISSTIDQEPYLTVTDTKEHETTSFLSALPSNDSESYNTAIPKQFVETVHPLGHLPVEDQQPSMADSDDDTRESEQQAPPTFASDLQQNPRDAGWVKTEEELSLERRTRELLFRNYGMWTGAQWEMRNWEDRHFMRPRICCNRGIDDRSCRSVIRISNDEGDHSNESGHSADGYACHFDRDPNHWNDHDPFCHGGDKRSGRPCHCYQRNQRNGGLLPWHGFTDLQNPMDFDHIGDAGHWPFPEPDCGKKRVGAGLYNPNRWTCFLNCILQCMVHTVPLVLKLWKADHPDPCPRASIGFCCYCSLKLQAEESVRCSGSAFYPEIFVSHLNAISPDFESGAHQDAQELLRCLLDKLDEASVTPRSLEEPSSSSEEGSVAKEIFGGQLKSQLHCPECNHCSDRSEAFLDLSLEINMVDNLMDALHSFTKVELIEDVMCDGCKSRVNMEKRLKIEQAPEVLVIHLKRFLNSGHNIRKIWDKVKYSLELDMNPFMSSSDDTPEKYDLYGVVQHFGSVMGGHYKCYIRSSQADWYKFDDDKVSRASEAEVLGITAYLLFYVKQGSSPWFSTLFEKESGFPLHFLNVKEESTSSSGQDSSDHCLGGPAEENGNGPSLPDFSQHLQRNANGNASLDAPDNLGEISRGTQELGSLTVSVEKNGHVDGCIKPMELKEDASSRGSLDTKEINRSTHGSLEDDEADTQEGSPQKNDITVSLPQTSHEHKDNCHPADSSLHDEIGGSSGTPSIQMLNSEDKATVEPFFNHEFSNGNNGTSKGNCEQL
ncbi:hypothetical protein ACP70R_019686 [Stipagrostis hirtigluma subsp. patula]